MGRTLVIPPPQHLYLLAKNHKDSHDKTAHDEMGFDDFFDLNLLRSNKGLHVLSMQEFLSKEAVTGGLKGIYPPKNSTDVWGRDLWKYLTLVADLTPIWGGKVLSFSNQADDFTLQKALLNQTSIKERFTHFLDGREPLYYDQELQDAHHIHLPGDSKYRILQHFYSFAFFSDSFMQSYYKRFIRDYMRYKDIIQCAGHDLVKLVRDDARSINSDPSGEYYALHIRRGDFQFKEVKISAPQIVENLHFKNGTPIIPYGALVYLSTDDPEGLCKKCLVQRKPCESYTSPKPVGCPEDTSWNAFEKAGL